MGTLYLVDAHNVVLGSSKINDTVNITSSEARSVRGSFGVNLPYDVPLDGLPADLNDLITKKYAGMLALYPGYQNIVYDEQIDATGWSPTSLGFPIHTVGERQVTSIHPGGRLESTTVSLLSTPSTCVVRWDAFQYVYDDDPVTTVDRKYQEQDPSVFSVDVTFDNGTTYSTVTSGVPFNIPLAKQGAQFKIRFWRIFGARKWLGSWALVY